MHATGGGLGMAKHAGGGGLTPINVVMVDCVIANKFAAGEKAAGIGDDLQVQTLLEPKILRRACMHVSVCVYSKIPPQDNS